MKRMLDTVLGLAFAAALAGWSVTGLVWMTDSAEAFWWVYSGHEHSIEPLDCLPQ